MYWKTSSVQNVYVGVGVCLEAHWLAYSTAHSPLKAGSKDALLCQARTLARHVHVLSHASTQLDFTSTSTVITQTVKNKPQTLRVCVCVYMSWQCESSFLCWWSFTVCPPSNYLKSSVPTYTCVWVACCPKCLWINNGQLENDNSEATEDGRFLNSLVAVSLLY